MVKNLFRRNSMAWNWSRRGPYWQASSSIWQTMDWTIGPQRAVGCVVYPAAEDRSWQTMVVRHIEGVALPWANPTVAVPNARQESLIRWLQGARAPTNSSTKFDGEIWLQSDQRLDVGDTGGNLRRSRYAHGSRAMMVEAQQIGEAVGARFRSTSTND